MDRETTENPELIIGRNPIMEALKANRELNQLFVARGERSGSIVRLIAMAKDRGIPIKEVDSKKLDFMCSGASHQGVAAFCAAHAYASMDDIFSAAQAKNEAPFIIICDEIEDPHNLGALIRTADAAGAHGVLIPKRRSASLSGIVAKASAGAIEYVPVVRVNNMAAALDSLKEKGVWIYCCDMDGEDYRKPDYTGAVGLVVGNEGKGVSRLIKEKSDFIVSLPMKGKVNSLNASVAAGVIMYHIAGGR